MGGRSEVTWVTPSSMSQPVGHGKWHTEAKEESEQNIGIRALAETARMMQKGDMRSNEDDHDWEPEIEKCNTKMASVQKLTAAECSPTLKIRASARDMNKSKRNDPYKGEQWILLHTVAENANLHVLVTYSKCNLKGGVWKNGGLP